MAALNRLIKVAREEFNRGKVLHDVEDFLSMHYMLPRKEAQLIARRALGLTIPQARKATDSSEEIKAADNIRANAHRRLARQQRAELFLFFLLAI
jgi:hypothetical protein